MALVHLCLFQYAHHVHLEQQPRLCCLTREHLCLCELLG
jgi:hypothetical protein